MTITLHRSDCVLSRGDLVVVAFDRVAFDPIAAAESRGGEFAKLRTASIPVEIEVPVGSKVIGTPAGPRLATHWAPQGLDAASVWHTARRGERGFRVLPGSGVAS
jgi:hypothetical protein